MNAIQKYIDDLTPGWKGFLALVILTGLSGIVRSALALVMWRWTVRDERRRIALMGDIDLDEVPEEVASGG